MYHGSCRQCKINVLVCPLWDIQYHCSILLFGFLHVILFTPLIIGQKTIPRYSLSPKLKPSVSRALNMSSKKSVFQAICFLELIRKSPNLPTEPVCFLYASTLSVSTVNPCDKWCINV